MSELLNSNSKVVINSQDLSDHVTAGDLQESADTKDSTAMGATTRRRLPGLKDWTLDVTFNQDYDASSVDETLAGVLGASVPVTVRPVNTAISATNPEYQGNAICISVNPVSGNVGDKASVQARFVGNGALTRATS